MQTPTPPNMKPGSLSSEGAGLTSGAYGRIAPGSDLAPIVPADQGVGVFNPGGGTLTAKPVTFYNGAQPPPVGGGGRPAMQVRKVG